MSLRYRARHGLSLLYHTLIRALSPASRAARVAKYWSGLANDTFVSNLDRVAWTGIPQVHLNHNAMITGERDVYWVTWMRDRYFNGGALGDVLSLGCGNGHLDRIFKQCGYRFTSFTGIDISAEAVTRARDLAREVDLAPSVSYFAADLNAHELPAHSFDFIYFFQSLHHIAELEWALDQCRRALRPGGLLLVNEFVGPSRFQWTDVQMQEANAALETIPKVLRRDLTRGGVKRRVVKPSIAHMLAYDPSESVRSSEIEKELRARFEVFESWNWGGTINHLVFHDIAGNFDAANPSHQAVVESLIERENRLISEGRLPSDFKVFLARSR